MGQNSFSARGFNNIYQNNYYDTYPKAILNLEQNIYNKGNINQNKNLPFYPTNVNSYKAQTEKLIYCECCGKLKRSKEYRGTSNNQQFRKSISKEIIAEESSKGDYIIKYNNQVDLNQPITSRLEVQGNGILYGLDENYSLSKRNFCPIHGYI